MGTLVLLKQQMGAFSLLPWVNRTHLSSEIKCGLSALLHTLHDFTRLASGLAREHPCSFRSFSSPFFSSHTAASLPSLFRFGHCTFSTLNLQSQSCLHVTIASFPPYVKTSINPQERSSWATQSPKCLYLFTYVLTFSLVCKLRALPPLP